MGSHGHWNDEHDQDTIWDEAGLQYLDLDGYLRHVANAGILCRKPQDEYVGECTGLLQMLEQTQGWTSMKKCLASRLEPAVQRYFKDAHYLKMQEHNSSSVRMYINHALDKGCDSLIDNRPYHRTTHCVKRFCSEPKASLSGLELRACLRSARCTLHTHVQRTLT